ncbi:MAG: carbon-nitrogen hydrolase family protein [Albidovulum sp.]|nr:carbon-nitrogen hydrolase family protein [Albidovulum sp.]
MLPLKIALLQLASEHSIEANLQKGLKACAEAAENGADVVLYPEIWSNGYTFFDEGDTESKQAWLSGAIDEDSEFVVCHQKLAKRFGIAIGLTYLQAYEGGPRNYFNLIDRNGEIVLRYAKVHICGFHTERICSPGNAFPVSTLHTSKGDIQVGAMICHDREHPESARIMALKGVELILVPNACLFEINRISQMRSRAFENSVALAMTNYPNKHKEGNGHSLAIVPMIYELDEDGQPAVNRDTVILDTPPEEGIYYSEFDIDLIRKYQKNAVWGGYFRRPDTYAELVKLDNIPKFVPDNVIHKAP